jgi:hypothetical protein
VSRLAAILVPLALVAAFAGPRAIRSLGAESTAPPFELGQDRSSLHEAWISPSGQAPASDSTWAASAAGALVPAPAPAAPSAAADGEPTASDGGVVYFTAGAAPVPVPEAPPDPAVPQTLNTQRSDGSGAEPPPPHPNPIRAAFYYPWFPQAWSQDGISPFTVYHPTYGNYHSANQDVIREHVRGMQYANIAAGISSWWGQGDYTDQNFATMLEATADTGFLWAVYYEPEGWGTPSTDRIRSDLEYIASRYASNPAYLRVDGRFVVFVYSSAEDRCEMAGRWAEAAPDDAFIVLKAFPNYPDCGAQPDLWHYYNPLVYTAGLGSNSFAVSPGFAKPGDPNVVPRSLERWRQSVQEMSDSPALFQLVLTFNEWGEGTAVESAAEWESASGFGAYLDVLHDIAP